MTTERTTPVINDGHDYALMYLGWNWEVIGTFERPGDALIERDKQLATEPQWLPSGRHRVVNRAAGTIIEWRHEQIDKEGWIIHDHGTSRP